MNIRDLQKSVHLAAVAKGWWPKYKHLAKAAFELGDAPAGRMALAEAVLAKLALVHSEVSEASEAARDDQWDLYYGPDGKPEGFVVEVADAVIRLLDLCEAMGLDLQTAIEIKRAYNATRQHRHGRRSA